VAGDLEWIDVVASHAGKATSTPRADHKTSLCLEDWGEETAKGVRRDEEEPERWECLGKKRASRGKIGKYVLR
jgi:hypothetical protein